MMWMMGYNDAGEINTIQDPFTGRKLRPLMPRPVAAAASAAAASTNHPCLTHIHGVDHFLRLNHHLAMVEQTKRELTTTQPMVVSSRWNPTQEQLQTLEGLYRRGTRTPTADQIQQITSQLRRYGKIEGKNVFYWFQNHKARERHKRRRQLESLSDDQQHPNNNNNNNNQTQKEENREPPVSNRTTFEVEQTKNWASPTNSSTIAEKTSQGATRGADEAECKADGCVQFNYDATDILLQQRRNATWQMMMHLSSSPSSSSSSYNTNPTNPSSLISTMQQQPHDDDDNHLIDIFNIVNHHDSAQTLQLFPLQSGREDDEEGCGPMGDDDDHDHVMTSTPHQFFEFLPMKN